MKYLRHSHLGGESEQTIPQDPTATPEGQTGGSTSVPQVASPIPTVMGLTRQQWIIMLVVATVTLILVTKKK